MEPGDALEPLGQPSTGQHLPAVIDDLDVVMILGPVIAHEQHRVPSLALDTTAAWRRPAGDLMVKCSPRSRGTASQQRFEASSRPAGARSAARPTTVR